MKKIKFKILVGVVVLIIVVAISIVFLFKVNNQQTVNQVTTGPDSVQDVSTTDTGVSAAAISYADALVKYADRRIQLDTRCQAYPNTVTYKDNTGIMIDNRSPETRTVKVGSTYTIKPWGFKIVVLPNVSTSPKTLLVDCDQYQNVATVLVQE